MPDDGRRRRRVIAVMPARNVAGTLQATFDAIPPGAVEHIILVDNASADDTSSRAEKLGIEVIRHASDLGYGGSLKTCLDAALAAGAEQILEIHPDNQYDLAHVPALLEAARDPGCALVMGSRFLPPRRALEGGMPWWKYLSNRALSRLNGWLLGLALSEFHSGLRVYNAAFVRQVPYRQSSDDFLFSFEIIVQAVARGWRVIEVPAFSRYFDGASSNPLLGSLRYGLGTLRESLRYRIGRLSGRPHPALRSPGDS